MQELRKQGMKQKLEKSSFRCTHYGNQSRGYFNGGRPPWLPTVPRLATRPSQSNPMGSGPEVLKRERGHVTVETWSFCGGGSSGSSSLMKNTWHIESNYLLQPPKYLIIVVNRFRYINNNFTKDRCSIPMDTTVVLGLHKFSMQATIDHHGPSMYSGHYTASINYCKRTFYCNYSKVTEFATIDTKNSSTAYVIMHKLIT